jgi:hypothetical protein
MLRIFVLKELNLRHYFAHPAWLSGPNQAFRTGWHGKCFGKYIITYSVSYIMKV